MEKNALISMIVPVYNVEQYIEKCLESIINQTYNNIEIILIDDGSTDKSGIICDNYSKIDNRIKVFHKKNGGLSDARNFGIKKSKGKYITFIDSDDSIESDYIEYLYNLIKKYDVKLSICAYTVVTDNKKYNIGKNYKEKLMDKKECLKRLLCEHGFTVSACAKLYSIELFKNVIFPPNKLCEDNGTIYKTIMKCPYVAYGDESKYNYYKRSNSIMNSKFNGRKLDLLEMTELMCTEIDNEFSELKKYTEKKRIHSNFSILRQMIYSKLDKNMQKKEKEIITYLKSKKNVILFNKIYDKRDKFAILSLLLGKKVFKLSWNLYNKKRS